MRHRPHSRFLDELYYHAIVAHRREGRGAVAPGPDLEPQHALVVRDRAIEVCHLELHAPDVRRIRKAEARRPPCERLDVHAVHRAVRNCVAHRLPELPSWVPDFSQRSEFFQNATTVASGLRVPKPLGDFLILRAVRESGGTAIAVSDADMVEYRRAWSRPGAMTTMLNWYRAQLQRPMADWPAPRVTVSHDFTEPCSTSPPRRGSFRPASVDKRCRPLLPARAKTASAPPTTATRVSNSESGRNQSWRCCRVPAGSGRTRSVRARGVTSILPACPARRDVPCESGPQRRGESGVALCGGL